MSSEDFWAQGFVGDLLRIDSAPKAFVLAGNYAQFLEWCVGNGLRPTEAVFVDEEFLDLCIESIAQVDEPSPTRYEDGDWLPSYLRNIRFVRTGTWWKHRIACDPLLKAMEAPL